MTKSNVRWCCILYGPWMLNTAWQFILEQAVVAELLDNQMVLGNELKSVVFSKAVLTKAAFKESAFRSLMSNCASQQWQGGRNALR